MNLCNYHLHSTGSDGKLTPEEVVKESIKDDIKYICFTDHYPLPKEEIQIRDGFHKKEYKEEVKRLIKKYKGKISISFGVELDWFEDFQEEIIKEIQKNNFDFIIGSVHFLKNKKLRNYSEIHFIDNKIKDLEKDYQDVKGIIKEYYKQIGLMAKSKLFDSIGHLDRIKFNTKNLFSEEDNWYKKEVIKCLKIIKESDTCLEINVSGLRDPVRNTIYPSKWILKEAKKLDIPITIGTDGHKEIHKHLDKGFEIAKEIGFDSVFIFKNREPIKIMI